MAFFDEPRPSRLPGAASAAQMGRWLRGAPSAVVAWLAIVAITTTLAVAASVASVEALARLADAAARTELTVFLPAEAPRVDAESSLARVRASPDVASARLVTKEEALAALAPERLPALQVRPNPLPDAIVARLRWSRVSGPPPSARLAAARDALAAAAPGGSVEFDAAWARSLDGWTVAAADVDRVLQPAVVAVGALLALAAALLAGRACRAVGVSTSIVDRSAGAAWLIGIAVGGIASLIGWYGVCAAVTVSRVPLSAMQPGGPLAGLIPATWQWGLAAAVVAGSAVGFRIGAGRIDASRQ